MSVLVVDQLRGRRNVVDEESGRKLGELGQMADVTTLTSRIQQNKSAMLTYVRLVEHEGADITPGHAVNFSADKYGTHTDGANLPAANETCDGVVDPFLTSVVTAGDTYLLYVEGPCTVICSGAIAGPSVVCAGSGKFKTAEQFSPNQVGKTLEDGSGKADDGTMRVYLRCLSLATSGFITTTVTADDSESTLNTIPAGVDSVVVGGVTNDANDFVVLPALADTPNGFRVTVIGGASSNFEVRTPASSNEEINSEDCDGTKEYLFTDTQVHYFTKIDSTIGWVGNGITALGTAVTAVVPD